MAGNHMSTLSPRQRMINMMYLVLTALLALNVSKSVLDAFFRVDKTLTQTVNDKTLDNVDRYLEFSMRAENNPEKIGKWNDLAQELKSKTDVVDALIDSIRYELWKAGGPTVDGKSLEIKDDWEEQKSLNYVVSQLGGFELIDKANKNSPAIIMLGPGGEGGAGIRLKNILTDYREYLLELDLYPLSDTTIKTEIRSMFDTSDKQNDTSGGIISWEENQYGGYPLVGVLTFLNQTKLDVRTAEDMMLELLEQKTGKSIVSIDKQIPYAIPKSSFVMEGDSLKASLFLAGIDTKTIPVYELYEIDEDLKHPETGFPLPKGTTWEITYNIGNQRDDSGNIISVDTLGMKYTFIPDSLSKLNETISTNADGMGMYSKKMLSKGTKFIGGFATVPSADEGLLQYPWVMEIRVESPTPVIAATNLNVIYFGLENAFTIAAPGYDPKDLDLRSNYAPLKVSPKSGGSSGEYTLKISDSEIGKKSKVKLSVIDKKTRKVIGKDIEFRLMKRPTPVTAINGKYSGDVEMDVVTFKTMTGLTAVTPESFVYDLRYKVIEFSVRYVDDRGKVREIHNVKSRRFDSDERVVSAIQAMKSGKTITFYNIKTRVIQNGKTVPGDDEGQSINVKLNN